MSRQSSHKVIVSLKEWEYLSNAAHRSLQFAEVNSQLPEASALERLAEKLIAPTEEVGRDQFVLALNRVELKLLLKKAKGEATTLTEHVLPGYQAKRSKAGQERTRGHIDFLAKLITKLEARL
jgi:hypothetical protein